MRALPDNKAGHKSPARRNSILTRIAFGATLLAALVWYVGIVAIAERLAMLDTRWVAAAAGMIVVAAFISAYNRYIFIRIGTDLSISRFLPVYWLSWAAGLVIPGQIGDVAALGAMMRKRGMRWHESLGRSLLDKLISFIVVAAIGIPGVAMLAGDFQLGLDSSRNLILVTALLLLVFFAGAWYMPWSRSRLATPIQKVVTNLHKTIDELAKTARQHPWRVIGNAALSVTSFVLLGASYWCMFRALGVEGLALITVVPIVAVCSLIAYVPVSFNGLGTAEAAGILLFGQLGIAATIVISAFICLRLIVFAIAWIPAAVILVTPTAADSTIR